MSLPPNAMAATADFEFRALQEAVNYRKAIIKEFCEFVRGDVVEVGAGIGQITALLGTVPGVRSVVAVEPDAGFVKQHRQLNPTHRVVEGTVADLPKDTQLDAIVSVNVLEHIEHDQAELNSYRALLSSRKGHLCLLVPARPEIYAPIDKDFGHFRRYRLPDLREKLVNAGFTVAKLHYFNFTGYFAWWLSCCVLRSRSFSPGAVRFYDRAIFPVVFALESGVLRPPIGQSLIAIARA